MAARRRSEAAVFRLRGGGPWYARAWDSGRGAWVRRSTGCRDEATARAVAARWRSEGERLRAGIRDGTRGWLEVPILEHVGHFLRARAQSPRRPKPKHLDYLRHRLELVVQAAGWRSIGEIDHDGLLEALAILSAEAPAGGGRARRRTKDGSMSPATLNHWRMAWLSFARWLHRQGRLAADPLMAVERWQTIGHETFERRALTRAEAARLLEATANSREVRGGLAGQQRSDLYALALATGYRLNELRGLRVRDLHLDATPPMVVVPAWRTKNGRPAQQPITAEAVAWLREMVAGRERDAPLWPSLPEEGATMIRADAAEAGIAARDADGRVLDFHGLRHTYGTWLAQGGVSVQQARVLMRHSSVDLTLRLYTHLGIGELGAAVEGAFSGGGSGGERCAFVARSASTTDDQGGPMGGTDERSAEDGGWTQGASGADDATLREPQTATDDAEAEAPRAGLEPATCRLEGGEPPSTKRLDAPELRSGAAQRAAPGAAPTAPPPDEEDGGPRRHARERADAGEQPDLSRVFRRLQMVAGQRFSPRGQGGAR